MTFGTTAGRPWVEAVLTDRGSQFSGRTFSRFHIISSTSAVPSVGEIWATSDHVVESHAHDSDELLYVLSGVIEINKQRLSTNEVVYIPQGTPYSACVISEEGSHVLRVALPNADSRAQEREYDSRVWSGALTKEGMPNLGVARDEDVRGD